MTCDYKNPDTTWAFMQGNGKKFYWMYLKETWKTKLSCFVISSMSNASSTYWLCYFIKVYVSYCLTLFNHKIGYVEHILHKQVIKS